MPGPVFGRGAELEAAERFLDGLAAGPAALVLEGEPGIGKTTVWREAVRGAEKRGFRVLVTRPAEAEAKLSFSGLADLLREIEDFDRLPEPQRDALEVALLRAPQEKPAARQAVFAGFLGLLGQLAADQSVLIAVDDVQWLDTPSSAALEFALRRLGQLPVGVLASVRVADEPRPQAFERAIGEAQLVRLRLGPLSLGTLHHLLKAQLDRAFPKPTLVKILEACGGNPFFALEIARQLAERGEPAPGEPLPVPEDVEDVVRARIRRLPPDARETLLTAAALSRPTVELVDVSALAKAEEAGLVQVGSDGRVSFTHPLFASAVYASASAARRRDVHRRLAELAKDPEERARHLALAASGPAPDVVSVLSEAAVHANARGAPDAAAELEELALRLTAPDSLEDRTRRECALGEYLFYAGELRRAGQVLERACDEATTKECRWEALILLAGVRWNSDTRTAADTAERALAEATDPIMVGRTHWNVAVMSSDFDLPRALAHARAAVDALAASDVLEAITAPLIAAWLALLSGESVDAYDPARVRLPDVGSFLHLAAAHDDFATARTYGEGYLATLRDRGGENEVGFVYGLLAQVDCWLGRFQLAAEEAREAVDAATMLAAEMQLAHAYFVQALVDGHVGRIDEARRGCALTLETASRRASNWLELGGRSTLGIAEFAAGEYAEADRQFVLADEAAGEIGMREPARFRFHGDHVEAVVALGDLERAEPLLARLEERARILPRPWILAVSARCSGLILGAKGQVEQAVEALEQALVHHEDLEMPFELARTLLVKGQLHRRERQKRLAREALERALEIFEELGSPLWAERTRGELARVRARKAPDELTETEDQIAALAAEGSTNREIASALFMSPKTVEKRLAAVYRKLGIRSRGELGGRMAERRAAAKT